MKNKNKCLEEERANIYNCLDKEKTNILTFQQINGIFHYIKTAHDLPKSTKISNFINFLASSSKFKIVELDFPFRAFKRYIWGEASIYKILSSLNVNAYFCHNSAIHFHKLADSMVNKIYINIEQSPKHSYMDEFEQIDIDNAFKCPPRQTTNMIDYQGAEIHILNGMHTGKLGVIYQFGQDNISVTDIERTLIDITVRPHYAGGVSRVLEVFKVAKGIASVDRIIYLLEKLKFRYPYHQAIGFYLDKAGFNEVSLHSLKKIDFKYKFYLAHGMNDMDYAPDWHLFYPEGINHPE